MSCVILGREILMPPVQVQDLPGGDHLSTECDFLERSYSAPSTQS